MYSSSYLLQPGDMLRVEKNCPNQSKTGSLKQVYATTILKIATRWLNCSTTPIHCTSNQRTCFINHYFFRPNCFNYLSIFDNIFFCQMFI